MTLRTISSCLLAPAALLTLSPLPAPAAERDETRTTRGAQTVGRPVTPGVFEGDLRDLPLPPPGDARDTVREIPRQYVTPPNQGRPAAPRPGGPDALLGLQEQAPAGELQQLFTSPLLNFEGQGFSGVNPPDTVGDVGQAYFVQMINTGSGASFAIYDKADGSVAAGPVLLESLGSGSCRSGLGDPIVLFDHQAGRWMLSEFVDRSVSNTLCVYVSRTSDPVRGGWYSYAFPVPEFPDYPKYAVWPDAYVVTTNEGSGPHVYALDRDRMLRGLTARPIQRFAAPRLGGFGFEALTPADLDGPAPPVGAPAYVMRHRDDEAHRPGSNDPFRDFLEVWELRVNWDDPGASTLSGPADTAVTEFDSDLCGLTADRCFPQPSGPELDPIREVVLWRLQYRNRGSHEALVGTFVTDVDGNDHGGLRWFELRRSGGPWSLHQEGTWAPDAVHRWLGSISMDAGGNIALAYNVTSSTVHPGLRYTGRLAGDFPGTMSQPEISVVEGSASNGSFRYGDYSAMTVDPTDGCTFWFTGEYNPSGDWSTRIAALRFDDCKPPTIQGVVWYDLDGDGHRAPSLPVCDKPVPDRECVFVGHQVFVDIDQDGQPDLINAPPLPPDPLALTELPNGLYTLAPQDLLPGDYQVRLFGLPSNFAYTYPAGGVHGVRLGGQTQQIQGVEFGVRCIRDCQQIIHPPNATLVPINDDARLYRFKFIPQAEGNQPPTVVDTRIFVDQQACVVAGAAVFNEGILTDDYGGDKQNLVTARLHASGGTWRLTTDLYSDTAVHGYWNVDLLCLDRSVAGYGTRRSNQPFFVEEHHLGSNPKDLGIPADQYVCGLGGFKTSWGDINERGAGNNHAFLFVQNGSWHARADFRSEGDHERWDISVLCAGRDLATEAFPPPPDKRVVLRNFSWHEDTSGNGVRVDTGMPVRDWGCAVAGWSAEDGDIAEFPARSGDVFQTFAYEDGPAGAQTWRIRAELLTHNDHEAWSVNLLCLAKGGNLRRRPNVSFQETGLDGCMGQGMKCQVLRDERIELSGPVIVLGGGFSGVPSQIGQRCNGSDYVEVYVDDRDPGTGLPRWSWPSFCVRNGSRFTVSPASTYDLRGVSIVGGATIPFELRDPKAPPVLQTAVPTLFPGPWGPGVALTWTPTLDPNAQAYEIQFSEDAGATWQLYTNTREIHWGGWINHHGNLQCTPSFIYCLKSAQTYSYRVRTLDGSADPPWSNVLSARAPEWTVVELGPPTPPGPYERGVPVEVSLALARRGGDGLQWSWTIVPEGGATSQVISGCQPQQTACRVRIFVSGPLAAAAAGPGAVPGAKAPEPGVKVRVDARDVYGWSASDYERLGFARACVGAGCVPQ